ncbi:hypothetical protein DC31_08300 [Microbacterium sp. CH12i]|uniref:hypothetical protein n=1 Tax=Microbacterium sp. CH12i TaxID=1479651 RepID=UPI0004613795|nr:hypothetical protein [Microbacterium sp. CH12i]KDA06435.1 hypothetical protein DC31_08300 [Microbacterium sp. CH12i]
MNPLLLLAAEWWWIAPAAAGAGAVAAVGLRRRGITSGRRLAFDAARDDLSEARHEAGQRKRAVKLARVEYARLLAERTASRATNADVASAKRALQQAEREAKASTADVRSRRVHMNVARAEIPAASKRERFPVARLNRAHDAVTARWMDYETDPAKLIAYPTMSDAKDPATAAFLSASRHALDLRPSPGARVTTADFAAYRDAVAHLERAFDVAEHTAKARANGVDPNATPLWQDTAQQAFTRAADALDSAAGAAVSAFSAWSSRRKPKNEETRDDS